VVIYRAALHIRGLKPLKDNAGNLGFHEYHGAAYVSRSVDLPAGGPTAPNFFSLPAFCRFWLPFLVAVSGCRFWLPFGKAKSQCSTILQD
jgi:hypothetical protein